jgi:predicted alpha/beta superfamily hydrolase
MHRHTIHVRVSYPLLDGPSVAEHDLAGARLALRSELDWQRDVAPTAVSADGTTFDFALRTRQEFLYFKPVLHRAGTSGEPIWAKGENVLALADDPGVPTAYPHFFADSTCSVCNVSYVPSGDGARSHAVRVFYPPGYGENTLERYPVLYMQDGQNLFFPDEAFGGQHWQVEETLHVMDSMNLIRKTLVVGLYPVDRMADYTKPGYEPFGRYVVEDLKPWVDAKYRTLLGPEHTAVMGSSLGGVVSFYLGWQYPQVFGKAACMSSTFGYRDDLMDRVSHEPRPRVTFYLDSGWPRDNYEVTRNMRNLLVRAGFREGVDLRYLAFPEARHNEQAWALRAHIPVQEFFGPRAV